METEQVKSSIVANVYHISSDENVPLHKHASQDEIFYCIKGSGFGLLEGSEQELSVGKAFIVRAGVKHSLRSDSDLYVCSFLVPVVTD
jgi:quercetin dioxygenase-like cupin family protein